MQSCYKHKKNRQLCLIICSFAYLCCINTLWRSFINLCFYFSAVTQFTKQITNFTENVVKLFETGNCEMGCWDLGFFYFCWQEQWAHKIFHHPNCGPRAFTQLPALSITYFTILYHFAETDFCSPVELQHAPLLLLCWLRTHRNRFLCPSPLWRCSTTVTHLDNFNIQKHDIIASWSTHSFLHLSFFLLPKESLL